jgi:hypothetical protein
MHTKSLAAGRALPLSLFSLDELSDPMFFNCLEVLEEVDLVSTRIPFVQVFQSSAGKFFALHAQLLGISGFFFTIPDFARQTMLGYPFRWAVAAVTVVGCPLKGQAKMAIESAGGDILDFHGAGS